MLLISAWSLLCTSHHSLPPSWDGNAPDTFLTHSCHWHLEEDFQLHSSRCQSSAGSASHKSHSHALQADFCAQAASECLVLNRQTPESTELLHHIVWENTPRNGNKGGTMTLAPDFQRGSRQPRDPDPLVHAADSLLGKIIGHFLLQLNSVHRETTENPMHPNPPQES